MKQYWESLPSSNDGWSIHRDDRLVGSSDSRPKSPLKELGSVAAPITIDVERAIAREAWIKAKVIMSMLQGTMALEGQGLDQKMLRDMTKETVQDLIKSLSDKVIKQNV